MLTTKFTENPHLLLPIPTGLSTLHDMLRYTTYWDSSDLIHMDSHRLSGNVITLFIQLISTPMDGQMAMPQAAGESRSRI